jgi:hypothetical protein
MHNTINIDTLDVPHHLILEDESPIYKDINKFIKEN